MMETTYIPSVSVILCFYNEERFIGDAIASVLAQDHDSWELILVDDGSTDSSPAIARHYAALHPGRIQYVYHPGHCNEGLSASRNLGITKVKSEYVAFIGADDVWLPGKLRCQLDIFRKTNVGVVLGASWRWRSWAGTGHDDVVVPVGVEEGIYCPLQLIPALYPLGPGAAPHTSAMMVRRVVLGRYEFEASFRGIFQLYEDQAFLCKLYLREVVFVSAACHNKCRQRPATPEVSPVYERDKYHMVRRYYLQWFMAYLKLQRWRYRRVRALVRRAAMPYQEPLKYKLMVEYPALAKALVARLLVKPLGM